MTITVEFEHILGILPKKTFPLCELDNLLKLYKTISAISTYVFYVCYIGIK